jgi:hypothetical protein
MRNRDILVIQEHVAALDDIKDDLVSQLTAFKNDLIKIYKESNRDFSMSSLLTKVQNIVDAIDPDESFDFLDELVAETSILDYNNKRTLETNAMLISQKQSTPLYFKPLGEKKL